MNAVTTSAWAGTSFTTSARAGAHCAADRDAPYGPYADDFPIEQHRFGPFPPIEQYYKSLKR
jgi:hypothetical protein